MRFFHKIKRIGMAALVMVLIVTQFLLTAQPAQAILGAGDVSFTTVIESIPDRLATITQAAGKALYTAALSALVNSASYFMRKVAYDTAVAIATGGKGQSPLAITKNPGEYIKQAGLDAVGEGIDALGESFGVDLCKIPDLRINVYLKIGFRKMYDDGSGAGGPKPKCSFAQLTKNWSQLQKQYTGDQLLSRFNADVKVEESDLGVSLGYIAKLDQKKSHDESRNLVDYLANHGFKSVTDLISGNVKTPAAVIEEETKALGPGKQSDRTLGQINGIYGAGAAQILPLAGSVFLNTLTGQLIDKMLKRGLFASQPGGAQSGGGFNDFYGGTFADNRQAAEQAFSFLFTTPPTKELNAYDIVSEFASCPPENPGLNNCVIDTGLQRLIESSHGDQVVTIKQAMDRGDLHRDYALISPRREFENTDVQNCYLHKYCYSNIQKLRKVRIFPLGFEIAALRSDPDVPWTLGQVVDHFEDCTRDANGNAIPDPVHKPFCHLIDPNWIIKAPEALCEAKVNGPERADTATPLRKQECVDVSTCIAEGPNGECLGNYGYCTKEKNIWRIAGDSCPAQYTTCKTFTNTETNVVSSYLARTLDYGECTAENVGCRAYSLEQASGVWVNSINATKNYQQAGRNQTIYFNKTITDAATSCSATAEGCEAFIPAKAGAAVGTYVKDTTSPLVHLKKAPGYLGCYDTDRTTPTIDWPQTVTDIRTKISGTAAACAPFAQVCLKDEVGCDGYTPVGSDANTPVIPGIVGNNACPRECVGYNAYKQEGGEKARFDKEVYPVYLIPSAAKVCPANYAGCDEFTNIEKASAGGETKEYYADLKYCEKPTGTNENTYYSWEGSVTQGYVLKVHKLLQISDGTVGYYGASSASKANFAVGTPAYHDTTPAAISSNAALCNETLYNLLLTGASPADPRSTDCRAFYEDTGRISYRLLKQTVSVSDACERLRKTDAVLEDATSYLGTKDLCDQRGGFWNGAMCQICLGGGVYESGSCVYKTIPSDPGTKSCQGPASNPGMYNGCRIYTGNSGNNINVIFLDEFEPIDDSPAAALTARGSWTPAALVNVVGEATQAKKHSLQINKNATAQRTIESGKLVNGARYELTFWAKGAPQTLHVELTSTGTTVPADFTATSPVSIGDTWQSYRLNADISSLNNPAGGAVLKIQPTAAGVGDFFIDTVQLRRVNDTFALIKNSWKIPSSCDSNPTDNIPGEMLGCTAYTNTANLPVYATGFEKLCRYEAIGCQPLYDTYNTTNANDSQEQAHAYNVPCSRPATDDLSVEKECIVAVGATNPKCTIEVGKTECFIPEVIIPDGATLPVDNIGASTVIIPADTAAASPVFLTVQDKYRCDSTEKGCMKVGLEQKTLPESGNAAYSHSDVYIINDPDKYATQGGQTGTLCRNDLVGCTQYSSDDGKTDVFFKDPAVTGNTLCEYKAQTTPGTPYGWFMKGIGTCSDSTSANQKLCHTDTDCGGTETCKNIGGVACYSNNIMRGGEQGIWSNKTENYKNFVGVCPAEANACTELVDVQTVSPANPGGTKYTVIYDDKVTAHQDQCEGRVSLKEGCVLFDKTDAPNKIYNSAVTYAASKRVQDGFVPVETQKGPLDSNLILKVDQDRTCAEWLACKSSIVHTDERGVKSNLCYQYQTCRGTKPGLECTDWVDDTKANGPADLYLSQDKYVERDTSWTGTEYSGYSLFDKYQINNLVYLRFDSNNQTYGEQLGAKGYGNTTYAAYEADSRFFVKPPVGTTAPDYSSKGCVGKNDFAVCGYDDGGRCYTSRCIYPIDGTFPEGVNNTVPTGVQLFFDTLSGGSCKGYPEQDSPYLPSVVAAPNSTPVVKNSPAGTRYDYIQRARPFEGVNVCQGLPGTEDRNCSCEYKKVSYKNGASDYLSLQDSASYAGICVDGPNSGKMCDPSKPLVQGVDAQCPAGSCVGQSQTQTYYGLQGYCLEKDLSRPLNSASKDFACLTWLPIQVSASGVDLYNADTHAGYDPEGKNNQTPDAVANAGQTYCLAATKVGNGPFDQGKMEQPLISYINPVRSLDDFYNSFFDAAGYPYIADESCESNTDTDTKIALCGGVRQFQTIRNQQINADKHLYSALQAWAWRRLGANALVLRAEHDELHSTNPNDSFDTYYGVGNLTGLNYHYSHIEPTGSLDLNACPLCNVAHFAPYEMDDETDGGSVGYGTVMHPPRTWGQPVPQTTDPDISLVGLSEEEKYFLRYYYTQSDGVKRFIGPYLRSPGGDLPNPPSSLDQWLYRSPMEGSLHMNDIQKVYFVPTGFPGGADGVNPELFSQELFIDFNKFRNDGKGEVSDVRATVTGDTDHIFMPKKSEIVPTGRMKKWTYALNASSNSGLLSFDKYNFPNHAQGTLMENADTFANNERNAIQYRYVLVAAGKPDGSEGYPTFFPQNDNGGATAPSATEDPFTTTDCKSNEKGGENWFAVGLDFNAQGEFLGYISRWCNGTDDGIEGNAQPDNGIQFSVISTLNNQCSVFASVYNPNAGLAGTLNKAWTQRIWKYGGQTGHPDSDYGGLTFGSTFSPFGSLQLSAEENTPSNKNILRTNFSFINPSTNGIPYSCDGAYPLGAGGLQFPSNSGCDGLKQTGYNNVYNAVEGKSQNDADYALHRLFQEIFSVVKISDSSSGSVTDPVSNNSPIKGHEDLSEGNIDTTKPPQIYSINPAKCFTAGSASASDCRAAEKDNITVSGKNGTMTDLNSDGRKGDEDIDGDGKPDPIIGVGSYTAIVNFFAFADDNRMPIRRVMVSWGDTSSPSGDQMGFFKNRKPMCEVAGEQPPIGNDGRYGAGNLGVCETVDGKPSGVTCNDPVKNDCPAGQICKASLGRVSRTDGYQYPRFGDASRACTPNYFEFVHNYTCGQAELSGASGKLVSDLTDDIKRKLANLGIGETDEHGVANKVCVFKPGAQVLDNWGWCNGVDAGGNPTTYYNDDEYLCQWINNKKAFTPYKGIIVVIPQNMK